MCYQNLLSKLTATEKHKMAKVEKYIKIVNIKAEAEVLHKKEQITKGRQNKMQKMIRTKNTPPQLNQEITTATRKRSINLGKSIFLQNNKKNKTTFDVVVTEPIKNQKTEEWRQSQIVIVPDTQETDEDQKSNGEDANDFLFLEQGATHTNQTNRQ